MPLEGAARTQAIAAQRNEITEHIIYLKLAKRENAQNAKILRAIAKDELKHYNFWRKQTGAKPKPRKLSIFMVLLMAKLFGIIFSLKFMERGEDIAQRNYKQLQKIPGVKSIIKEEGKHEQQLLRMLQEERLEYAGSVVLGLNDALVELTGALAGFTLALQESKLIALAGLVTGIAASMSMAVSGYLETKHDQAENSGSKSPLKSSIYTGTAYVITVLILVAPFFLFGNVFVSLAVTLGLAILIIAAFNFYIAVAKEQSFWKEFGKMALISLGVAAISFIIAYALRTLMGIDV